MKWMIFESGMAFNIGNWCCGNLDIEGSKFPYKINEDFTCFIHLSTKRINFLINYSIVALHLFKKLTKKDQCGLLCHRGMQL